MTATTNTIRWARLRIPILKLQLKRAINDSKKKHGIWEDIRTRRHGDEHAAYLAWKASVAKSTSISREINALSLYVKRGATAASPDIAQAIARWEGGQSRDGLFHPYRDPAGVWTIGYGHTSGVTGNSRPLTKAQAIALLEHDLNTSYVPPVRNAYNAYHWKPNQKMFDAMVSFCYNLGPGYFSRGHSIGDAMATRSVNKLANAILLYDRAGGKVLPGLLARRKWEAQLLKGGTYN